MQWDILALISQSRLAMVTQVHDRATVITRAVDYNHPPRAHMQGGC